MATTHAGHAHNAETRGDPTNTKTLRERRFVPAVRKRFRTLRGLLRATVGYENDAFGLAANAEPAEVFDFPTDAGKEREFYEWLRGAIDEEVIEPAGALATRDGRHWTGAYVRGAYTRGVSDADRRLAEAGVPVAEADDVAAAIRLPVHETTLQALYSRTFENLEDIGADAADEIRETMSQALAEGVNPRESARRLTERVQTIERTRGVVLARTETINAYTEATLTRYEQLGVGEVTIRAEWATAGDDRVCPICASLEGRTFTTREARTETFEFEAGEGVPDSLGGEYPIRPPAHPSCRCSLLPSRA